MKGIAFNAWFAAIVSGALGGCGAGSVNAQDKAAAPIGSWKGSAITFDLGSDGRVSFKDPGVAEFTGRWEWLPTTQTGGVLTLRHLRSGGVIFRTIHYKAGQCILALPKQNTIIKDRVIETAGLLRNLQSSPRR